MYCIFRIIYSDIDICLFYTYVFLFDSTCVVTSFMVNVHDKCKIYATCFLKLVIYWKSFAVCDKCSVDGVDFLYVLSKMTIKSGDKILCIRDLIPIKLKHSFTHWSFPLKGTPYEVTTYTSNKGGASTDADVYIVLYGTETCTKQTPLCTTKAERKSSFKKGAVNKFVIEV